MVFPSVEFAVFFPVVLAASWALMPHPRAWKPFALAASYVFYAAADPRFCLLPAGVTLANQAGCCGAPWAAQYADRVRHVMNACHPDGSARVYWLNLPAPRDRARRRISRAVNAAIAVAAEPYRAQVRVLDLAAIFTPGGRYHAMTVGGRPRTVREPDGIHLNDEGSAVALGPVLAALRADFGAKVPR